MIFGMNALLFAVAVTVGLGLFYLYKAVEADKAQHVAQVADRDTFAASATRWHEHAKKAERRLARVEALCAQRCEMEPGECTCWFCKVRAAARADLDHICPSP